MKILKYILSGFLFVVFNSVFAQEFELNKDEFSNKEDYKIAKDYNKEAEGYYATGRATYPKALELYLKIVKMIPNNAVLNYRIGNCYLYSVQKVKCIDYYKKAYQINPNVSPDILYVLAMGYHLSCDFDKAIEYYNKFRNQLPPKELQEKRVEMDRRIEECNYGKELIKNPVRVFIDNLGPNVNSAYRDYAPVISTDESVLMFTSRRPDTYGGGIDEDDGLYYEDIYISYFDGKNWGQAKNVGKPLNSNTNDATVALSPDGQQLMTFNGKLNGGDILLSNLKGTEWSSPSDGPLSKNVNTKSWESAASFSFDGKTLYFVSDKEGGYGKHDIYVSHWDMEKERWGEAQNLGAVINTQYDETGVFMHPDGRTLYFSSTGHKRMGGYDLFKSEMKDDGTWGEPENLGYPINSPDDDLFFVLNASGKHGYYSTVQDDSYGDYDIYMITFRGPEKSPVLQNEDNLLANVEPVSESVIEEAVEVKTMRLTILKGTVKDALTLNPVEAQIEIVDNVKNEVISTSSSNSSTGKYVVSLPSGRNYGIAVKATGYLFHSENFDIPAATNYQEVTKDILMNKMVVGSKVILKNIFFDYAKATLRSESFPELDRLVKLLTDFPNTRIEISGHTDNQGSLQTNQKLSENRAKAVVDYLISKGIASSRLEYKGYAYFQPVATNDNEEGRQQNRRVEFKVLQSN